MATVKILLVDDERSLSSFITTELRYEGYEVTVAEDGEEALHQFERKDVEWSMILLDWMLPKLNGLEVCRRIRKTSHVPVIFMTARDYIGDKVAGLDGGADDYITKPFEIEELLARIRVILRRNEFLNESNILQVADLKLDLSKRTVERFNQGIYLTQKEFDLLVCLMKHNGGVMSRENLINEVWGYDYVGQTNIIDVYIRTLRNKIDTDKNARLIHTQRGIGYSLREEGV